MFRILVEKDLLRKQFIIIISKNCWEPAISQCLSPVEAVHCRLQEVVKENTYYFVSTAVYKIHIILGNCLTAKLAITKCFIQNGGRLFLTMSWLIIPVSGYFRKQVHSNLANLIILRSLNTKYMEFENLK